jgi:hypothetical protein
MNPWHSSTKGQFTRGESAKSQQSVVIEVIGSLTDLISGNDF